MRTTVAVLLVPLVAGCAAPAPSRETLMAAHYPLTCSGPEECSLYWRRAQVWIARNSDYRIQSVTDTVITTYGPAPNATERAYQVIRAPGGDGREEITIGSRCANLFGCTTDAYERAAAFKQFVRIGR